MKSYGVWAPNLSLSADYFLVALSAVIISLVLLALYLANIPTHLLLGLCLFFLSVSTFYVLNHLLRWLPSSIVSLSLVSANLATEPAGFQLRRKSAYTSSQAQLHSCVIWPWIIFLNLQEDKRILQLLLTPAHIGRDDFRRLAVILHTYNGLTESGGNIGPNNDQNQ